MRFASPGGGSAAEARTARRTTPAALTQLAQPRVDREDPFNGHRAGRRSGALALPPLPERPHTVSGARPAAAPSVPVRGCLHRDAQSYGSARTPSYL